MSQLSPETPVEDFHLLDDRGCLTYGAMCFVEQLDLDQRAVVARHIRSCPICAQQQTHLTVGTEWVRRSGPRVPVPVAARLAARQAVVRGLRANRYSEPPRRRQPSFSNWVLQSPAVAGAVIAIVAAAAGLLMARFLG